MSIINIYSSNFMWCLKCFHTKQHWKKSEFKVNIIFFILCEETFKDISRVLPLRHIVISNDKISFAIYFEMLVLYFKCTFITLPLHNKCYCDWGPLCPSIESYSFCYIMLPQQSTCIKSILRANRSDSH